MDSRARYARLVAIIIRKQIVGTLEIPGPKITMNELALKIHNVFGGLYWVNHSYARFSFRNSF